MFSTALTVASVATEVITQSVNYTLQDLTPSQIIALALFLEHAPHYAMKLFSTYQHWNTQQIKEYLIDEAIKKSVNMPLGIGPFVENVLRDQVVQTLASLKEETDQTYEKLGPTLTEVPKKGRTKEEILATFAGLNSKYQQGLSGGQYINPDQEQKELMSVIEELTSYINPLQPGRPRITKMEAEVIAMTTKLFNGPEGTRGLITHGGTHSIFEALAADVENLREMKGVTTPEIIAPTTAHAAFDKAAKMLGAKLVLAPVDRVTGKVNVKEMEKLINENTCVLAVSAPSFPYGVIDPIAEVGALGLKHNLPVHADLCLGGFILAWVQQKYDLPMCDFRNPGITSISADIHKYGYAKKGISIVLKKPGRLFSPHLSYTNLRFPGGQYVTPGKFDGSRSANGIAITYALYQYFGVEGYTQMSEAIVDSTRKLAETVAKIPGVRVPYMQDLTCVVGIETEDGLNPLIVQERIEGDVDSTKHWSLNTITQQGKPVGFHFCVTLANKDKIDNFIERLKAAVEFSRANPDAKPKGMAKAYGMIATGWIPDPLQNVMGDVYQAIQHSLPGAPVIGFFPKKSAPVSDNNNNVLRVEKRM